MKRTIAGLFFLSLLITVTASAEEVSLNAPSDYKVEKVASLGNVSAFTFDFEGNYIVAENMGNAYRVSKVAPDGTSKILLDRTSQAITNLSFYQGKVYIVTRGNIYKINKGKISDVLNGLPSAGDYGNSGLVFVNGSL
ncbi:MAG: hypothetical protein KW802_00840, partial [Candidatus Doudnabacteria bacterium]|nr:hypothetical protein [Candidatus Doudnabacteria bacterium]